jgi:hypothetical protein
MLTTYAVCAGPSIREAVAKTVRLRTGRSNLQLMVFDPDMSPAPDGLVDSLSSDETPAGGQDPPHQLLGVSVDKHTHQVRRFPTDSSKLQYSSPKELHTEVGNVEMNNHSKWVESRLAQGRRKPTITEL